jgi:hypothetical protein
MREPSSRVKASEVGGKFDDIGGDYRTRHNAAMNSLLRPRQRCLMAFLLALALTGPAFAWNATGHRLIAEIAWQQLSKQSRESISGLLVLHPDYPRWEDKAAGGGMRRVFAEASTWADEIRHDPRFVDRPRQDNEAPATTEALELARHRDWHYLNYDDSGNIVGGQLDRRIGELTQILRSTFELEQKVRALPWLLHLIGDIHQPMHVGFAADSGGNGFDVDNPFNQRQSRMNLHRYWDDLPGPTGLRGKKLEKAARHLIRQHEAPPQGSHVEWRDETHALLALAYPESAGESPVRISKAFHQRSKAIADQQIAAAGYRLGRQLEAIFGGRVPRGTK